MKIGTQILALFVTILLLTNCDNKSNNNYYDKKYADEINETRKDLLFFLARNNVPGANITIAINNKIIYSEGMGLASKDLEVPVTRETKFRIGELSELFTSLIYLKMVDERILHPDSSVQFYIPDFPVKEHTITLHNLVNNCSGIRDEDRNEKEWEGINISLQKGLENFKDFPLESPPNMYQTSSMFNYNLLGAIMEITTNTTFSNLLAEYITDTLNLPNTLVDNPFITIKGRTNYFDHNIISQVVSATFRDMRYRAPSQGLLSNAEDLVKFGNAILYSNILSEKTKDTMFDPISLYDNIPSELTNGWGLMLDKNGNKIVGKRGNVTGGNSAIIIYPESGLVIACATNLNLEIDKIPIFKIASHFLKESN